MTSSTVDQIKERLSIVDVISSYIKLEKAGANMKARCPFHNEKTPSFHISPARNTFHCFGCSKGGDIFTFVEEIEGVDFPGALKILAAKAGVEIRRDDHRMNGARERLYAVIEDATQFFEKKLLGGLGGSGQQQQKDVVEYLAKRGLTDTTIANFRIGFAPADWRQLYEDLQEKKYSDAEMEKAGLVIMPSSDGKAKRPYDRFRSRIMFPIADSSGRIVAFSGRIFGPDDGKTGKYINSPETELYNKSKILFAYDKAKMSMRREDVAIVVEGQMDVILSHQSGLINTVAASGTALTTEHLELVHRMTENIVLAFDADDAGLAAAGRGIKSALAQGFDVKIAELPAGTDPADMVVADPLAWKKAIAQAKHVVDFYLSVFSKRRGPHDTEREYRRKIEETVLPYVSALRSPLEQAHFVGEIAGVLGIAEAPVWEAVKKATVASPPLVQQSVAAPPPSRDMQRDGDDPGDDKYIKRIESSIVGILLWQQSLPEPGINLEEAFVDYRKILGREFVTIVRDLEPEKQDSLIFQAEMHYGGRGELPVELKELFSNLHEQILRRRAAESMLELKRAELSGDETQIEVCLKHFQEITKELNTIISIRPTSTF